MLFLLEQYFKNSPTRKKIVEGLFNRGISVKDGKFFCGSIEISPSQVAVALGVNRRTVYETLKQIEDNEAVSEMMENLEPELDISRVSPLLGSQVITVYVSTGYFQRVLSEFFKQFSNYMFYAVEFVSRNLSRSESYIRLIVQNAIPRKYIEEFSETRGVQKIRVVESEKDSEAILCQKCNVYICPNKLKSPLANDSMSVPISEEAGSIRFLK